MHGNRAASHTRQPRHHESSSNSLLYTTAQKQTIYTMQQCNHQGTKPGTSNHTMTHLSVATHPVSNSTVPNSTPKATQATIPVTNDCNIESYSCQHSQQSDYNPTTNTTFAKQTYTALSRPASHTTGSVYLFIKCGVCSWIVV